MGIFDWFKGSSKNKDIEKYENEKKRKQQKVKPIQKTDQRSIEDLKNNIIKNFSSTAIVNNYNISVDEINISYWFEEIIMNRVDVDYFGCKYPYSKNAPIEEKWIKNIQGHYDTYKKKYGEDYSIRDIYELMRIRIIMYRYIYKSVKSYSYDLNKENIKNERLCEDLKLIECHAGASLYSCISYALYKTISKKDIIKWFPEFEEDLTLSVKKLLNNWEPNYIFQEGDKKPLTAIEILFNDNKKSNFSYEDNYNDRTSKEVKDKEGIWTEENIENELLESNDLSEFAEIIKEITKNYNEDKLQKFNNSISHYLKDMIRKNYIFVKNMCNYVEIKLTENENWTFKNNAENRLYELRYPLINNTFEIEEELPTLVFNSIQAAALRSICGKICNKLNEYDNLDRPQKFEGYEFMDQIQTRCRRIVKYLNEDNNRDYKINDVNNKVKLSDCEDIGDVTHYNGKPLNGIACGYYKNGNTEIEFNMLNGLKHGISREFDENGNCIRTIFYQNDEYKSSIEKDADAFLHHCEISKNNNKFMNQPHNLAGMQLLRIHNDNKISFLKPYKTEEEIEKLMDVPTKELKNIIKDEPQVTAGILSINYMMAEAGLKYILIYNSDFNPPAIDCPLIPLKMLNKKDDKDDTETFFNGKLFTGVGYELHISGYLSSTITFKNGKQNGISNEYDENGLIKTNYYWIDGEMCFPT